MDYTEYKGKWWLPGKEYNKIFGTLKFYPNDRLELEVNGIFESLPFGRLIEFTQYDFIYGEDYNGKKITLFKNRETYRSKDIESRYLVVYAFIGHHFVNEKEISFDEIEINFHNLKEWFGLSGIGYEYDDVSFAYRYTEQDIIKNNIDGEYELNFIFGCPCEMKGTGPTEIYLKDECSLEIKKHFEKSLDRYFEIIEMLKVFFSLSMQLPIYMTNMNGVVSDEGPCCNILFGDIRDEKDLQKVHKFQMPLIYDRISEEFEGVLKNLHRSYHKFENMFNLYHGIIYNQNMFPRQEFLFLVNALESYHRLWLKDKYISDEDFKNKVYNKLVDAIPDDIPVDLKNSLKSRLQYHNEYSLKKRLDEVFERFIEPIDFIIENRDDFTNRVKNMRNYYSHYFELEEEITFEELNNIKEKLKTIVEICILGEIDVDLANDLEIVDKLYKNKRKFISF